MDELNNSIPEAEEADTVDAIIEVDTAEHMPFGVLPNKVYDVLKDLVCIWLPAFATFYAGMADVWGFPYADKIPTTITLLIAFLGTGLKISTHIYNKNK